MSLVDAFKDHPEAVAWLEVLLRGLDENTKPHAQGIPELLRHFEREDPTVGLDAALAWLAGRNSGVTDPLRSIFGDRIHLDNELGQAIIEFRAGADKPDWWNQLFAE